MSRKFDNVMPGIVLLAATVFPFSLAGAQAVSLQEQLAAQYKLVKMGSDTSGYSVVDKGTLLAIQKGGVLGVPYGDQNVPATRYEGGTIKGPSGLALMGRKSIMGKFGKEQTTHLFAVGDKVYPMKIDVNLAKDSVTLGIVACDTCNKTDPPTYNKAKVVFQFPKGSLANASCRSGGGHDRAGSVDQQRRRAAGPGRSAAGRRSGWAAAASRPADQAQPAAGREQPQAEPQSIEKGMTTDQVEAAMGQPEKKVISGQNKSTCTKI